MVATDVQVHFEIPLGSIKHKRRIKRFIRDSEAILRGNPYLAPVETQFAFGNLLSHYLGSVREVSYTVDYRDVNITCAVSLKRCDVDILVRHTVDEATNEPRDTRSLFFIIAHLLINQARCMSPQELIESQVIVSLKDAPPLCDSFLHVAEYLVRIAYPNHAVTQQAEQT